VCVAAILFVIGRFETVRRSGTAAAIIVSTRFQAPDPIAQAPPGTNIQYAYSVDGVMYSGADFRPWVNVAAHDPKVCFEPGNPSNHLLVHGSVRCGVDDGP
jgi:hypothetical protein